MDRKKLIGIIFFVIMVSAAAGVVAQSVSTQWTDYNIPLTATIANLNANLNITSDANGQIAVTGHDFGAVTVGQSYEWTFYVYNSGSVGEAITYLPTNYGSDQTNIIVTSTVVEYGVPGEMPLPNLSLDGTTVTSLPYALPEKDTTNPVQGFYLMPTKMIKVDVKITVVQLDGTPIKIPFEVCSAVTFGRDKLKG